MSLKICENMNFGIKPMWKGNQAEKNNLGKGLQIMLL